MTLCLKVGLCKSYIISHPLSRTTLISQVFCLEVRRKQLANMKQPDPLGEKITGKTKGRIKLQYDNK